MTSDKDYENSKQIGLEHLRTGLRILIRNFGRAGMLQIVREIIYALQHEEGYNGITILLEGIRDYFSEEEENTPADVKQAWRWVVLQISYTIRERLTNDRRLP